MAVDPIAPAEVERSVTYSPIENEIPTYRAISPMAITSFVLGLFSVATFATTSFVAFGLAAIITGALAQRKINRYPDALTGGGFAQAGIGMGIVFTLSALTFTFVREMKVANAAKSFAQNYGSILQESKSVEDAFWYRLPPAARTGKTPKSALQSFYETAGERDMMMADQEVGPYKRLVESLKTPGGTIRFIELERSGYDELDPYAFVLYEIQEGHVHSEDEPEGDHDHAAEAAPKYALVHITSEGSQANFDWRVEQLIYPYQRKTAELAPKAIDDGHGHSGHGH